MVVKWSTTAAAPRNQAIFLKAVDVSLQRHNLLILLLQSSNGETQLVFEAVVCLLQSFRLRAPGRCIAEVTIALIDRKFKLLVALRHNCCFNLFHNGSDESLLSPALNLLGEPFLPLLLLLFSRSGAYPPQQS